MNRNMQLGQKLRRTALAWVLLGGLSSGAQAGLSATELHWQHGLLDAPSFASGSRQRTDILTFQHVSADAWTHRFMFVDFLRDGGDDGFNDNDLYGEFYVTLSLSQVLSRPFMLGPIRDVGLQMGVNMGAAAKVYKLLPGLRLGLKLPGFTASALELNAYLDRSVGLAGGGAPAHSDSWQVNWVFNAPFTLADQRFSVVGHVEYIASRRNELGAAVSWWVLAQPQLRWDLGHALGYAPAHWFLGVEWQYWNNKLGDPRTDENTPQLLLVWRF